MLTVTPFLTKPVQYSFSSWHIVDFEGNET